VLDASLVNVLHTPASSNTAGAGVTICCNARLDFLSAQARTQNKTPRDQLGCVATHLPGIRDLRFCASVTALYCTLHTLSTSGTRRLNSSKQPHDPLAAAAATTAQSTTAYKVRIGFNQRMAYPGFVQSRRHSVQAGQASPQLSSPSPTQALEDVAHGTVVHLR
jgi:hypothetical protein